jgi:nitrogen regulatory protein PII
MKLIKTIIRPNKVDDVKDALAALGIAGMTVTEVRGHGKQKGHTAIYRGREYNVSLLPKMEIDVVVADSIADEAIKAIVEAARTGEIGDGRVFVLPVLESYRMPQRLDRIEACGAKCRHHAEENANGCGKAQPECE